MSESERVNGARVRRGSTAAWILMALVCLFVVNTVEAIGAAPKPRQVMAIMITKFPRYATWPPGNGPNGKMVLCVATTDNTLKTEIAKILNQKDIGGRKWEVKAVSSLKDAHGYPLVFVGKDMQEPDDAWYDTMREKGVMTFGEKASGKSTSIINFVVVKKKVKFDLNLNSAGKAGLKINSRLADVAREVIGKP